MCIAPLIVSKQSPLTYLQYRTESSSFQSQNDSLHHASSRELHFTIHSYHKCTKPFCDEKTNTKQKKRETKKQKQNKIKSKNKIKATKQNTLLSVNCFFFLFRWSW